MPRLLFSLFCCLGMISCGFPVNKEPIYRGHKDECNFTVDQYKGIGLRWGKNQFPIVFYIHESLPLGAQKNFMSAVDNWNMAWINYLYDKGIEPFELFKYEKFMIRGGKPKKDRQNIVYFMGDSFVDYANNNKIQAITALYSNSRNQSIEDTDILVNDRSFKYYYSSQYDSETVDKMASMTRGGYRHLASSQVPSLWSQILNRLQSFFHFFFKFPIKKEKTRSISASKEEIDIQYVDFSSLMIHELGHVPGMTHVKEGKEHTVDSVMEARLPNGYNRREISNFDLRNMFCAYVGDWD